MFGQKVTLKDNKTTKISSFSLQVTPHSRIKIFWSWERLRVKVRDFYKGWKHALLLKSGVWVKITFQSVRECSDTLEENVRVLFTQWINSSKGSCVRLGITQWYKDWSTNALGGPPSKRPY